MFCWKKKKNSYQPLNNQCKRVSRRCQRRQRRQSTRRSVALGNGRLGKGERSGVNVGTCVLTSTVCSTAANKKWTKCGKPTQHKWVSVSSWRTLSSSSSLISLISLVSCNALNKPSLPNRSTSPMRSLNSLKFCWKTKLWPKVATIWFFLLVIYYLLFVIFEKKNNWKAMQRLRPQKKFY